MTGIFGQVPTNGGYVTRSGPAGVLGQLGPGVEGVYVEPPTVDDSGLLRIAPGSKAAFVWSINMTTTSNPLAGATFEQVPEYFETYAMKVVPGMGDEWLTAWVSAGYVVLFLSPAVEQIGPSLQFFLTSDPQYVAESASSASPLMVVIDGPEPIITAAKAIVAGETPPVPGVDQCPAGTTGIWPVCIPEVPGGVPGVPSVPSVPSEGCPPGQVGYPPLCVTVPGLPGAPPVAAAPKLPSCPEGMVPDIDTLQCVPEAFPPAGKPAEKPLAKAAVAAAPDWLLPVLIGVGAVSVFVLVVKAKRRR